MTTTTVDLPQGTLRLAISSSTDVGAVRRVNEDALLADELLLAVADGMGGHARGDLASAAAVEALRENRPAGLGSAEAVFDLVEGANAAVRALDVGGALCGTTLTGLMLVLPEPAGPARWALFNVGDSRVYRWDGAELQQLTVDHSAVQELVSAGLLTRESAESHPDRNIVTRALGADDEVETDVWTLPVVSRASYLLCSDGLTKELSDEQIAALFARRDSGDSADLAQTLVRAAVDAGGRDNVTVLVVDAVLDPRA
ncbi:serine/threonine-protein phosphatase [Rathayibacter rathayi]|uniref:Serine/threonine-protein phosphatase n=1 Tax=Rathayibacter rathayi TaxID=33887 RepID=A0ABD6WD58_RATRA|nr:protein phosphatase 2C domain-containing protein [Rathayibacter rathayi]PPF16259.1 serine/threonine-protein phosphatase [Rathayibacter rathayi]PPF51833.1 serine/threonine-protein phosphatase [Rathayibacter rathayi]PPG16295.1 serine/threonine-protein phosphatase [Rathayibacter rathayi]PPG47258.1 serine/threonine-protein phosphatase [Rathayibacter rathayi]PPG90334.1 serine/threonine-protein phosphatase [Rathayibacter rathayi]